VAAVARLMVPANREARHEQPSLHGAGDVSAPELALRLLDDLNEGNVLYVAELEGRAAGYAQVTGLMVGDGGHLVELRRLYVASEHRRLGVGRRLLELVRQEVAQRASPPALRAWAPAGSTGARFLETVGGTAMRPRWKVGPGGLAVRGAVYGWSSRAAAVTRRGALAT
jgi:GNAT superfamily N-acetyltransferase